MSHRPALAALVLAACSADGAPTSADAGPRGPLGLETRTTACMRIGGLDRVFIEHLDFTRGDCVQIVVVTPSYGERYPAFETPDLWRIESVLTDRENCREGAKRIERAQASGHLSFTFPDHRLEPERMSLEASILLDDEAIWNISATDIPVTGSCQVP